jgi:hypothetical protein
LYASHHRHRFGGYNIQFFSCHFISADDDGAKKRVEQFRGGHPDTAAFWKSTHRAQSVAELQSTIEKVLGRTGLVLFAEFDHGEIVRKEQATIHRE